MLTFLILFGVLLCCLRFVRLQFLRRQQYRNLTETFLQGYQNSDRDQNSWNKQEMTPMSPGHATLPHQRLDLESGPMPIQTLHGGCFPSVIYCQRDLHCNLQQNIESSTLECGSRRLSSTPRNSMKSMVTQPSCT